MRFAITQLRRRLADLSAVERRRLAGMAAVIVALHAVGWGTMIAIVAPLHLGLDSKAFGIGIGVTAYVLGLSHAFDADHIAAIDNTTRRMLDSGKRPLSVGFWFALGHSTVVFGLALLVALGARSLPDTVSAEGSVAITTLGVVGMSASVSFLLLVAWLNLASFRGAARLLLHMRHRPVDAAELDGQLKRRGLINRAVDRLGITTDRPSRMYAVGLLFGLGFDTATEIILLVTTGTGVAAGVPWYVILCVPVLFAAGMSLVDTIDGSLMTVAYRWSLTEPVRKLYVNLTMTGLSVAVAVAIATCQLISFASDRLGLDGWWAWTGAINASTTGMVIAGLLLATWLTALLVWRLGRIHERWTARS